MEEVRDCNGSLVCMADGMAGLVERKTSKEHVTAILPVGGKIAFDTKGAYTELERVNDQLFLVNSFANR